jgi:DNA-binding GntR family transcriptional regulator
MISRPELQRVPLRQQIYAILRERIVKGEIAPGETVKDVQTAASLGASRTPVREALVRLTSEGMLLNLVGRGFRVPPLERREVEEAHPLLTHLEPLALASAPACSAKRARELERLTKRMQKAAGDASKLNDLDSQWHRTLIEGCINARLHRYIEELRDTLRRYELAHLNHNEDMHQSIDDHRAIAAAEATGDRETSIRLLTEHWQRARGELLARLNDEDES